MRSWDQINTYLTWVLLIQSEPSPTPMTVRTAFAACILDDPLSRRHAVELITDSRLG